MSNAASTEVGKMNNKKVEMVKSSEMSNQSKRKLDKNPLVNKNLPKTAKYFDGKEKIGMPKSLYLFNDKEAKC